GDLCPLKAPDGTACWRTKTIGMVVVADFAATAGLVLATITEHHLADGRSVAALDLADEAPQLADYLPGHVAAIDLSEIRGQMALFDGLIADNAVPKVIDVGYRAFGQFFAIAHKIDLFEEARRRGLEPVILFMIYSDPKAAKAYSRLRRSFPGTSLL